MFACRGTWVAQLVKHPTMAQDMISRFVSSSPASGSVLADSSETGACFRFCVSLSLCPSPAHALSLSVSKINKRQNIKKNKQINLHLPLKTFMASVRETREEGYCIGRLWLSLTESLLSIGSMESFSFHTALTGNLSNDKYLLLPPFEDFTEMWHCIDDHPKSHSGR